MICARRSRRVYQVLQAQQDRTLTDIEVHTKLFSRAGCQLGSLKLQILIVIKFKNAAHDYRDVSVDLLLARPHSTPWKINSSTRSERVCTRPPADRRVDGLDG